MISDLDFRRRGYTPRQVRVALGVAVVTLIVGSRIYFGGPVLWQQIAAACGSTDNSIALGWRYREGNGVSLDFSQAFVWFEQPAKSGSAKAQYDLGIMYYYGLGIPEDSGAARNWFEHAAQQDYAPAVTMLGLIAAQDQHDTNKAIEFWQRAVSLKDDFAEYLLGLAYLDVSSSTTASAYNSDRDLTRALFWLEKARRDGVAPIGGILQQVWMTVPDESVERVAFEVSAGLEKGIAP